MGLPGSDEVDAAANAVAGPGLLWWHASTGRSPVFAFGVNWLLSAWANRLPSVFGFLRQHRDLPHADRVDRLPEHTLGTAGVADRAEYDLVAAVRETCGLRLQMVPLAVELRGIRQPHQLGHLRPDRGQIGCGVVAIQLAGERPVRSEQAAPSWSGRQRQVRREPPATGALELAC
jgi:hypothetical protein